MDDINYNPEQNIWNKIEKFSKTGQEQKRLISPFAVFFDCYCQSLISSRGTGHWAMSPPRFEIFLIFPYCRQRTKYCSVYKLESQKEIHMIGYVSGIEIANHLRFAKTPLLLLHEDVI